MFRHTDSLFPMLLKTLSDESDEVSTVQQTIWVQSSEALICFVGCFLQLSILLQILFWLLNDFFIGMPPYTMFFMLPDLVPRWFWKIWRCWQRLPLLLPARPTWQGHVTANWSCRFQEGARLGSSQQGSRETGSQARKETVWILLKQTD